MTRRHLWLGALIVALALVTGGDASAMSLEQVNLVDLLRDSTSIVSGSVSTVTDGIDANGVPYTEITLHIRETIRGTETGTYTFRQFGLMAPRLSEDGTRKMLAAPEAFPRYSEGEDVLLFLYQPAALTGMRTTYGLAAGKFSFGPGRIENELANEGLFQNVSAETLLKTANDIRMLETEIGAVNPDTFTSFVRRAVAGRWVENCRMWDTLEGKTCPTGGSKKSDGSNPPIKKINQ
jgi:hypothetical protein